MGHRSDCVTRALGDGTGLAPRETPSLLDSDSVRRTGMPGQGVFHWPYHPHSPSEEGNHEERS
jgi:hypothetical protein